MTDGDIPTVVTSGLTNRDGGLPLSASKELFSQAYVRMIAAAAGCSIRTHEADYDGVDLTVVSSMEYDDTFAPQFDLQLKCTSQTGKLTSEHMTWPMDAEPFRRLTSRKRYNPAYLGILVVPPERELWLSQNETQLVTESRMYWQAATELGTINDGAKSKTVKLPRSNQFDVPQLLGIMRTIAERGDR